MRIRRALLLLVTTGATLIGAASLTPAAASAAASTTNFAQRATAYQNATIADAMARIPGGTRVSTDKIEWGGGVAVMIVPTTANGKASRAPSAWPGGCPTGYMCYYNATNYGGVETDCESAWIFGAQYWCTQINTYGPVRSFSNATAGRAWLQQYESHTNGGVELCISPRGIGLYAAPVYYGPAANDYWSWMSTNKAGC